MYKQRTEYKHRKCFRCISADHLIFKCLKPPKYNIKRQNTVRFNESGNLSSHEEYDNGDTDNNQKIFASMAQMSGHD